MRFVGSKYNEDCARWKNVWQRVARDQLPPVSPEYEFFNDKGEPGNGVVLTDEQKNSDSWKGIPNYSFGKYGSLKRWPNGVASRRKLKTWV